MSNPETRRLREIAQDLDLQSEIEARVSWALILPGAGFAEVKCGVCSEVIGTFSSSFRGGEVRAAVVRHEIPCHAWPRLS